MTCTVIARSAASRLLGAATASCSHAGGNAVPPVPSTEAPHRPGGGKPPSTVLS